MKAISILSAAALLVSSVNAGNDPRECEGEEGVSCIFVEIVHAIIAFGQDLCTQPIILSPRSISR